MISWLDLGYAFVLGIRGFAVVLGFGVAFLAALCVLGLIASIFGAIMHAAGGGDDA